MKIFRVIFFALLALGFVACEEPEYDTKPNTAIASLGTPADNEIWFITTDERDLMALNTVAFNTTIAEIEYSEFGINVIRFAESLTSVGIEAFSDCYNLKNISLPNSVTSIGERAFFNCTNLECITLGDKIVESGMQAFDNCLSLHTLHITSIGDWCKIEFANPTANPIYYCNCFVVNGNKINKLTIPQWVSHIGNYAFYNYTVMSSIEIPASVKSIGKDAFYGCDNLSKVDIEDVAAWCKIDFAKSDYSNPLSLMYCSLYINGKAASTVSLEGVERVSPRAFMGCYNIISLITDTTLTTIGEEAFRGCNALSSVELQSGVTEIGGRAFMGCSKLENVTCYALTPPVLGDDYVFAYNAEERKIKLLPTAIMAYRNDAMWSQYAEDFETVN